MERFFKLIYFAGMVVEAIVRAPYNRRRRQLPKTEQRITPPELGLLSGLFVGMFLLPILYSVTSWLDFANYRISPSAKSRLGGIGTGILAAAVWLFWRSHRDLGTNWSPSLEISAEQELVTGGVYSRVRHPMYTSHLLWSTAQALLLPNWIAGFGGLLTFLPLYLIRIPHEEQMMLDHFGDEYRKYATHTGRIVPRL